MSRASDLLKKLDWEGDEAVLWFDEDDFEDFKLRAFFTAAQDAYVHAQENLSALKRYLESVIPDEERLSDS